MALTVADMPLHVSVGDVAASITESENGIMLKLPVSLNLPIVGLLAALQLVQQDQVLKTLQSEHSQESQSSLPKETVEPTVEPTAKTVEPTEPFSFRLPGDNAKWHDIDNAKWHDMCSKSSLQGSLRSCRPGYTYDITSSQNKWTLHQQDFAVLDDLKIERKEPVPIKRMAPTPGGCRRGFADLAVVEARAEEAFNKAMAMRRSASASSLRPAPETPPPAGSFPEGRLPPPPPPPPETPPHSVYGGEGITEIEPTYSVQFSEPTEVQRATLNRLETTFQGSGPDPHTDPMKRPLSAVAAPRTKADVQRFNSLNLEDQSSREKNLEYKSDPIRKPRRGLQNERIRKQKEAQNQSGPDEAATDAEAEATPGDVAEAEDAAADQTGSTGSTEALGSPHWNKQRKECKQQ